jgi:hypothetical protein
MSFGCVGISWMRSDDPLFLAMLASRLASECQEVRAQAWKTGTTPQHRSMDHILQGASRAAMP